MTKIQDKKQNFPFKTHILIKNTSIPIRIFASFKKTSRPDRS